MATQRWLASFCSGPGTLIPSCVSSVARVGCLLPTNSSYLIYVFCSVLLFLWKSALVTAILETDHSLTYHDVQSPYTARCRQGNCNGLIRFNFAAAWKNSLTPSVGHWLVWFALLLGREYGHAQASPLVALSIKPKESPQSKNNNNKNTVVKTGQ